MGSDHHVARLMSQSETTAFRYPSSACMYRIGVVPQETAASGLEMCRQREWICSELAVRGTFRTPYPPVIPTAADLAVTLVNDLPPDLRKVVEAYFFDGESVGKIQRRHKLKRQDLEAIIEAALDTMRLALRSRGVRAVADVI